MRSGYFLALPVLATIMNLLFASFLVLVFHPRKTGVSAQQLLQPGNIQDLKLGIRPTEPEPYLTLLEEAKKGQEESCTDKADVDEDDEKDPMLRCVVTIISMVS